MVELNPIISIITLNINELSIAIKRPILSDWIFFFFKARTNYMLLMRNT